MGRFNCTTYSAMHNLLIEQLVRVLSIFGLPQSTAVLQYKCMRAWYNFGLPQSTAVTQMYGGLGQF